MSKDSTIQAHWLMLKSYQKLTLGYLVIFLIGWLLLSLPIARHQSIAMVDGAFVSISALSTTGLTPLSLMDSYNWFGQLVILLLIQLGGLGYMTALVLFTNSLHYRVFQSSQPIANTKGDSRKKMLSDELLDNDFLDDDLLSNELGTPRQYSLKDIIKVKLWFTFWIELIGALLLTYLFWQEGVTNPLWQGIFHSVSAFCTAGMSLFNNGLIAFSGHVGINITVSVLCLLGSFGFIVFTDLWRLLVHKTKNMSFTSAVIIRVYPLLLLLGTFIFFFFESSPVQQMAESQNDELAIGDRLLLSFFHVVSASSTAGFNTVYLSLLGHGSLFLLCMLMFIGSAPTGTGGGIKVTVFSIVLAHIRSSFKGLHHVTLFGVIIPAMRVSFALSVFTSYILMLAVAVLSLCLVMPQADFSALFFETVSAFSTVGLSMGITSQLTDTAKWIISLVMFIGRMGFITLGLVLFADSTVEDSHRSRDIAI